MVLCHPEGVVAEAIHLLGVGHSLVQDAGQFPVRVVALVDRRAAIAGVLQVDRADVGAVEFGDHGRISSAALSAD
jgi:hypothetical protein